ncbi:DinB family protein [Deinococcus pimensis]|uniref:DinB family protein n=1 Tax=Deinococcus pimensis TaxID=309888 RepID=UPI0004812779|nr:DinB family protein [Deinococcus pimensis]
MTTDTTVQPRPLPHHLPKDFARPQRLDDALAGAAASVERYIAWLDTIPDDLLHVPVTPGKWSVAEHAHHLVRTSEVFAACMTDRARGRPIVDVPLTLMWPDGRLVAPAPIQPTPGLSRSALQDGLKRAQQELERAARHLQALELHEDPCVPTGIFEPMTAVETAQLVAGHTLHHLRTPHGH